MGLQSQLSDCSTESIPILAVAIIASFVGYLRSLALKMFDSMGLSANCFEPEEEGLTELAEQLQVNRIYSRRYGGEPGQGGDCVFCLSSIRRGEVVRTLACRHVFHKRCLDGWLESFKFSCPLCRSAVNTQGGRVE
ncbi:E3 ubiquitin-protein ligase RHA2A-like [Impatiens glandulifera]|uniref:E3 ubiquitin-protein ligase RHA2A-like n=1 Tax=Impatiens glandulifera TaxID=253017 RepID=UPI001FB0C7F0|nr:E3 ubiquitin-protein ligase RHA2A-like [Impatiens glandulifera]